MFLNHKLHQNKTYSISESGRKLISDRTSRSLPENKKSTSSRVYNCECLWHFCVIGHSESIQLKYGTVKMQVAKQLTEPRTSMKKLFSVSVLLRLGF